MCRTVMDNITHTHAHIHADTHRHTYIYKKRETATTQIVKEIKSELKREGYSQSVVERA